MQKVMESAKERDIFVLGRSPFLKGVLTNRALPSSLENLKDAKELICHEDITMTDRYSHLTFQHHLSKQEQLANYYNNS